MMKVHILLLTIFIGSFLTDSMGRCLLDEDKFLNVFRYMRPEERAALREVLDILDRSKDGEIVTIELLDFYLPLTLEILKELIIEVNIDGDGELDFEEFITLMAKPIVQESAKALGKKLREAFKLYDKEGNGHILKADLRKILRKLDDPLTNTDKI